VSLEQKQEARGMQEGGKGGGGREREGGLAVWVGVVSKSILCVGG